MYTSEQVINGLVTYTDREVIPKLGTSGKWIVGTMVGMIGAKASATIMKDSAIIKAVGAMDENGLYDVELIAEHLKKSAERYGNLQINVPMVGMMTFTTEDIERAKNYIKGDI